MLWRMSVDTSHRRIGIQFIPSTSASRPTPGFRQARACVPVPRTDARSSGNANPAAPAKGCNGVALTAETSSGRVALSLDLGRYLFAEDLHLVDQLLHGVRREIETQQVGDAGLAE